MDSGTVCASDTASAVCSYCSSSYEDPRMLSCLHSFCLQCISKIHEEGTTSITCHSCNHPTSLPTDGGVASLPVNIRLRQEMEQNKILQRVISSPPPRCDSCDEENTPSVAYCKDCSDMLCTDCWHIHKRMKMSKSHSTIALNDLKRKNQPEVLNPTPPVPVCSDHDDQKLRFYCTQCNVPVCVECTVDKHSKDNGHTVQELGGYISQTKTTILQDIKGLPENKNQLEQLTKNIDEMKRQVEDRKSEVDVAIRKAISKLYQLIDQQGNALLTENHEIAVFKKTRLSIQQEEAQRLLESTIQCHLLSSIATSEYSDVQLSSIAHTLNNRAVSLHQQFTSTPLDVCVAPHVSVDVNTDTLANVIGEFGGVVDSSVRASNSTVVVPCQRLGIGAEMKVRVVTRDSRAKVINEGGAKVRGRLSGNGGIGSLATDNGDGTYLVSVIPQQLGQHQLFTTVNGQYIQDSPFTLNIVPQRDYTTLRHPVQTITDVIGPKYIAFSDNGDMFVTSSGNIYVYDNSGNVKATIGSKGSGELQFQTPHGIAINGEVVYVAEWRGQRIHKLTTGGEFLGTFGQEGSDVGHFKHPYDVKISPDGKVYIADCDNDRVQVFNPDWTISHIIDGKVSGDGHFYSPVAIAFGLSGDVHVAGFHSSSVTVFTLSGQFVRQYDVSRPLGIAIDASGYSIVTSFDENTLSIFDVNGTLVHSVGGFNCPFGVSVSPDGSVWVADMCNDRLVKY